MLDKVFGHASIPMPENFVDKVKQLQKSAAIAGLQQGKTNQTFFTMISKTNMSTKKSFLTDD